MSHDSSSARSPLIKTILIFCLSLLSLVVLRLTALMLHLGSFHIRNPGLNPTHLEKVMTVYIGFAGIGGCLLEWGFVWLLVRYRWLARSTGKWLVYCLWAIAALNGVLLLIPLVAWKSAL